MIKIGQYNDLRVSRFVDFGAYLTDDDASQPQEVLLPARYVDEGLVVGDTVHVFVYTDSQDRPVATTEIPFATAGEFAFLQVTEVNRVGAFLDWGLLKNLLVPYSEQRMKMRPGGIYLVYVYLDKATGRVVASAKTDKFLGNVFPDYERGARVQALVTEHTEIGYRVIVDNLHKGMIYDNELYAPVTVEQSVTAYVKAVRPDGKLDLTLTPPGTRGRVTTLADTILKHLADGTLTVTEKSSPDDIKALLHCSKKDFKKTLGALYREHRISIHPDGAVTLV